MCGTLNTGSEQNRKLWGANICGPRVQSELWGGTTQRACESKRGGNTPQKAS